MKHKVAGKHLNRNSAHRKALRMNFAVSVIKHERVTTTLAKAKALRPFVEETVDAIRGGDVLLGSPGSPEPSTARSQLSQSSVASSLSAFSVASSRRKQQRDFFSPVQVLPRVARRR